MAPRKPSTNAKPTKKRPAKDSNKVIKRPARGYHKFRNGLLNVAPKGEEIEAVKINQSSPLLRLPAEIRTRIWEYALGHRIFRAVVRRNSNRKLMFVSPAEEPNHGMALLRTSRQIYSETAALPAHLSTLAFERLFSINAFPAKLKPHQRKQIRFVRFEGHLSPAALDMDLRNWRSFKTTFAQFFPALERLELLIYDCSSPMDCGYFEEIRERLHHELELISRGSSCEVTVKQVDAPLTGLYY